MKSIQTLAAGLLLASAAAFAQHGATPPATAKPYAGLESRDIKALSAEDTERLLQGQDMSLALAAELNGYPGPMHVLELAQPLRLSARQREQTEALMAQHKAQARELGAQLVQAERELDLAFAGGKITSADLTRLTRHIGDVQAVLRDSHLQTHLRQEALLEPQQVAHYGRLRGYASNGGVPAPLTADPSVHGNHQ